MIDEFPASYVDGANKRSRDRAKRESPFFIFPREIFAIPKDTRSVRKRRKDRKPWRGHNSIRIR